jgi:hypothetical protein
MSESLPLKAVWSVAVLVGGTRLFASGWVLLLEAGRAVVGVVLVDRAADVPLSYAVGGALIVTGQRVDDLVSVPGTVVAR